MKLLGRWTQATFEGYFAAASTGHEDAPKGETHVGSTLAWCMMLGMIGDDARNAQAYLARLASRPAFARAQAD